MPDDDLHVGDVFAGYTIHGVLGRGGMGTVYLAKHPRLPRQIALKLLNRELTADDEVRRRFEREADVIARLEHPNIVNIYDRGAEDDQLWISMQYVRGTDASRIDLRTLAPARAAHIVTQTAEALDYAHRAGVLHRDIKPANILLAQAEDNRPERVVLSDFGIARMRDSNVSLTLTGTFTATLAFASPEQLTGTSVDPRADQYALGCTLFALLTGHAPYAEPDPANVIQGHLHRPVPRVTHERPNLSPAIDAVIARAMAKKAEDRYPTCSDFAIDAGRALLGHTPPRPMPQPPQPPQMPQMPQMSQMSQPRPMSPPAQFAAPPPQYRQPPPRPQQQSNAGLVVALLVALVVAIVILAIVANLAI